MPPVEEIEVCFTANLYFPSLCFSTATVSSVVLIDVVPSLHTEVLSRTGLFPSESTISMSSEVVPSESKSIYKPFSESLCKRAPVVSVLTVVNAATRPMPPSPFKSWLNLASCLVIPVLIDLAISTKPAELTS